MPERLLSGQSSLYWNRHRRSWYLRYTDTLKEKRPSPDPTQNRSRSALKGMAAVDPGLRGFLDVYDPATGKVCV